MIAFDKSKVFEVLNQVFTILRLGGAYQEEVQEYDNISSQIEIKENEYKENGGSRDEIVDLIGEKSVILKLA